VDADGNPLTDVYLFDQDGRPIDTSTGLDCTSRYQFNEDGGRVDVGEDGGQESGTPYPRGTWDYDPSTGECRFNPPGPLVVAVPATPATGVTAPPALQQTQLPTPPQLVPAPPVVSVPPVPSTGPPVTTPGAPPTR
jgi:hypothetical protein